MAPKEPSKQKAYMEISRKGFFLWLFVIFMVSAWMFVLGILVGRGTAPVHFDIEKLQKELMALKEAVVRKELKKITSDSESGLKSTDLGFYEQLKETDKTDTPAPLVKKKAPASAAPAGDSAGSGTHQAAKVEPATSPTSVAKPSAAQPARPGSFTIQVAATKDEAAADRLVAKLRLKGFAAYWVKAEVTDKGTWYRIRVGPYAERQTAEPVLQLLKKENLSGFIVQQ